MSSAKKPERGLILVISGPSGGGKGTVANRLNEDPDYILSVSATTRAMREGEIADVSYHFLTREQFDAQLAADNFLERNCYVTGDCYGTLRSESEKVLASGKNLILEIDVNGGLQVKKKYPDTVLIMLLPPSPEELERRLRTRGTETEEKIRKRLSFASEEVRRMKENHYDYVVCNETGPEGLEAAVSDIKALVRAEKLRLERNRSLLDAFD